VQPGWPCKNNGLRLLLYKIPVSSTITIGGARVAPEKRSPDACPVINFSGCRFQTGGWNDFAHLIASSLASLFFKLHPFLLPGNLMTNNKKIKHNFCGRYEKSEAWDYFSNDIQHFTGVRIRYSKLQPTSKPFDCRSLDFRVYHYGNTLAK